MVNILTKSKGRILPLECCSLSDLLGDTLKLDNEEFHSDGESPACRQAPERRHRQRIRQYVPHVEIGVCSTARYITNYGIKQVRKFSHSVANVARLFSYCIEIFIV
jgi:hypothetical protein